MFRQVLTREQMEYLVERPALADYFEAVVREFYRLMGM